MRTHATLVLATTALLGLVAAARGQAGPATPPAAPREVMDVDVDRAIDEVKRYEAEVTSKR